MTDAPDAENIWAKGDWINPYDLATWIDFVPLPGWSDAYGYTHYRRADLPHPDDAARIAALEEANARLAVALAESQTREANAHRAYLHAIGAAPE